jgi:hypothetical protein
LSSSLAEIVEQPATDWQMPIVPEDYDRSTLSEEEMRALQVCLVQGRHTPTAREVVAARQLLVRLDAPIADVFHLRYQGKCLRALTTVQRLMRSEMYRLGKAFWQWPVQDWLDILCPTVPLFQARHGKHPCTHMSVMDAAYLLGGVTDLRPVGIGLHAASAVLCQVTLPLCLKKWDLARLSIQFHGRGFSSQASRGHRSGKQR